MRYDGNLTAVDGDVYAYTEITGHLVVPEGARVSLPVCTTVGGYVAAYEGARVLLPVCTTVGGSVYAREGARVLLPVCTTVGVTVAAGKDARVLLPVCTTVGGSVAAGKDARVLLPVCTTVGGSVTAYEDARVSLPKLRHQGDPAALRRALARRRLTLDDGILCRVVARRGHVSRVRRIGQTAIRYLVTDGTHTAHGATLVEARADLRLKQSDRDTTPYQGWTRDTVVSQETAIAAYRAITGACREGVRDWLAGRSIPARVSVARILDETAGQYGHAAFAAFVGGAR